MPLKPKDLRLWEVSQYICSRLHSGHWAAVAKPSGNHHAEGFCLSPGAGPVFGLALRSPGLVGLRSPWQPRPPLYATALENSKCNQPLSPHCQHLQPSSPFLYRLRELMVLPCHVQGNEGHPSGGPMGASAKAPHQQGCPPGG